MLSPALRRCIQAGGLVRAGKILGSGYSELESVEFVKEEVLLSELLASYLKGFENSQRC